MTLRCDPANVLTVRAWEGSGMLTYLRVNFFSPFPDTLSPDATYTVCVSTHGESGAFRSKTEDTMKVINIIITGNSRFVIREDIEKKLTDIGVAKLISDGAEVHFHLFDMQRSIVDSVRSFVEGAESDRLVVEVHTVDWERDGRGALYRAWDRVRSTTKLQACIWLPESAKAAELDERIYQSDRFGEKVYNDVRKLDKGAWSLFSTCYTVNRVTHEAEHELTEEDEALRNAMMMAAEAERDAREGGEVRDENEAVGLSS